MSTHANMVKMGVTSVGADPYTITLGAASSGYQHINSAITANATVDILITMGTTWEVARNCTYTYSATPTSCTITRGTLESSSTGSRITTFDNTALVSVVATADSGRRWDSAALEHVAGTDADTTMAVGMMYVTDMSAWATADRTYTLPADAAVGSRIGIMVTAGDASHELIIKPNTGDTINGGSAAAEWSRLFITGEVVILRCITANSAWVVEYDGRIPCVASMYLAADEGSKTASQFNKIGLDSELIDIGGISSTSAERFDIRRAGKYIVSVTVSISCDTDGTVLGCIYVGGTEVRRIARAGSPTASSASMASGSATIEFAVDNYVELYGWHAPNTHTHVGGNTATGNRMYLQELL